MPTWLLERVRCPDCRAPGLRQIEAGVVCARCHTEFPRAGGRPVLIPTDNALFPRSAYLEIGPQAALSRPRLLKRLAPSRSVNLSYRRQLRAFANALGKVEG